MKNIAFIVNPIAGPKTKNRITKLIRDILDSQQFSPTVVVTEYAGHATQLAQQFAMQELRRNRGRWRRDSKRSSQRFDWYKYCVRNCA